MARGLDCLRLKPTCPPSDEDPVVSKDGPVFHRLEELIGSPTPSRGE